jgi:hypothetical protein
LIGGVWRSSIIERRGPHAFSNDSRDPFAGGASVERQAHQRSPPGMTIRGSICVGGEFDLIETPRLEIGGCDPELIHTLAELMAQPFVGR